MTADQAIRDYSRSLADDVCDGLKVNYEGERFKLRCDGAMRRALAESLFEFATEVRRPRRPPNPRRSRHCVRRDA